MNFYSEFLLLAVLIISFTAFIAVFLNAFGNFLFQKKKKSFQKPLHQSQKNWKKLMKDLP
ncbi:hypothetical protein [Bacillus sp. RAR_GA_16]|uniref:hypothetical protein n=1 Tax=Bacillus sp. RAR_GA_16 TaxID=2876774 RepID=UPI001CCEA78B|nr:hypothetical protein [Bacillus sp. RAR_GA_16]MCA0172299.1 hypothetical protein [Bacillus sp. RAR_GA_16]